MDSEELIDPSYSVQMESLGRDKVSLLNRAQELVEEFWAVLVEENKSKDKPEKGMVGPRFREKGGSATVDWMFFNKKRREGHKQTFGRYIKKGKTSRYSNLNLSKYAPEWEMELIIQYEEKFSVIRKGLSVIRKAEVATAFSSRAMKKLEEDINEL